MSDKPQAPTPPEFKRDAKGRLLPGQGSLNPSGQPAWVQAVRLQLSDDLPTGANALRAIIAGEATVTVLDKEGTAIEVGPSHKDQIAAVKVLFEFTLPKPKQEVELSGSVKTSPLAGMSREELLSIALGKPPEK